MLSRNSPPVPQSSAVAEDQVSEADIAACLELLERVWPKTSESRRLPVVGAGRAEAAIDQVDPVNLADVALDRFVLRQRIGEGGFGIVFLAYDSTLNREVAIKVPRPHVLAQSRSREHFLHEAQAAALLDHPGIVSVYEIIETPLAIYIVSAHCNGESLASWMHERGPVKPKVAAWIVAQLADAVRHAHSRGVLHRDLKPANVLLEKSDTSATESLLAFRPKLTDFGLAKIVGLQTRESMSQFGTAHYMSPEQVSGHAKDVGIQSDIFSLGVILYELLAGVRPFEGDALVAMRQVIDEEPASLLALCPGLPLDIVKVCQKCLEKGLASRYATADDLLADLERYLRGEPVLARPLSFSRKSIRWVRRRPMLAAMTLAMVCSVAVGLTGIVWQWRRAELNRAAADAHAIQSQQHLEQAEQSLQDFAWLLEEKSLWAEKSGVLDVEAYGRLQRFYNSLQGSGPPALQEPLQAAMESFRGREAVAKQDLKQAKTHFETALTLWRRIIRRDPERRAFRRAFALCLHNYTLAAQELKETDPARPATTAGLLFGVDPANATDAAGLLEYVDLLYDLARSYSATERYAESLATLERSQAIAARLTELYPTDQNKSRVLQLRQLAALVWKRSRRPGKAILALEMTQHDLEQWEALGPLSVEHRQIKADVSVELGVQHHIVKRYPEARASFESALDALRTIPADPSISGKIATIQKRLGLLYLDMEDPSRALEALTAGRASLEDITRSRPLTPAETRDWAELSFHSGKLYRKSGDNDSAFSAISAAVNGYVHPYADFSPVNREVRLATAESHALLGTLLAERGQVTAAVSQKNQALDIYYHMARKTTGDRHAEHRIKELKKEIESLTPREDGGK